MSQKTTDELRQEISKRRTFAIISHPDAGKTTLTEKLLLYGGRSILPVPSKRAKLRAMRQATGWKSRSSGEYRLLLGHAVSIRG